MRSQPRSATLEALPAQSRMNKKSLSERDICSKFITPAVVRAGWDEATQIREEVSFTKGRIIVRGKLVTRTMLYDHLFSEDDDSLSNLIDVHVSNVRKKLGRDFIITRRGEGYLLDE